MPVMYYRTTGAVSANVVTKGIFNGELHEYVQSNRAVISIYAVSKQIDTRMTVNIGGRLVMNDQLIPANTSAALPRRHSDRLPS